MSRAHRCKDIQQSSFSNLSITSLTSQLILQPFCRFTYITAHSPTLRRFTYITAHSPTFPSLYLHHSSAHSPIFPSLHLRHSLFSNPSVPLPTSQLIFQPFFRFSYVTALLILQPFHHFTYITAHSPTLPSLYLHHSSFSNPSVA